jgi:hypothetical protein
VKEPLSKKFSLDFIRPFQKGESEDFVVTWDNDLESKYLWLIN